MSGESTQKFYILGVKSQLFQREAESRAIGVAFDFAIELRALKIWIDIRFKLCKAEFIGSKAAEAFIQGGRYVTDLE